jgi:hypothetical protein
MMHEYTCNKCGIDFYSSIVQQRCTAYSCQSTDIVSKPWKYEIDEHTKDSFELWENAEMESYSSSRHFTKSLDKTFKIFEEEEENNNAE